MYESICDAKLLKKAWCPSWQTKSSWRNPHLMSSRFKSSNCCADRVRQSWDWNTKKLKKLQTLMTHALIFVWIIEVLQSSKSWRGHYGVFRLKKFVCPDRVLNLVFGLYLDCRQLVCFEPKPANKTTWLKISSVIGQDIKGGTKKWQKE